MEITDDTFLGEVIRPCLRSSRLDIALPAFHKILQHEAHRIMHYESHKQMHYESHKQMHHDCKGTNLIWDKVEQDAESIVAIGNMSVDMFTKICDAQKGVMMPEEDKDLLLRICEYLNSLLDATPRTQPEGTFLPAPNTAAAYASYVRQGRRFLADFVGTKRSALEAGQAAGAAAQDDGGEDVDYDELVRAFEGAPNRYSAMALELFLVEKCVNQNLGRSTGDGIHAGFKTYWEMMADDRYRGPYKYNEVKNEVRGNPADSAQVQDIVHAIRNKSRATEKARSRAGAMLIEDMRKMMLWSERTCRAEWLDKEIADLGTLTMMTRDFLMRAFMSSGFVLWTRISELCRLQRKHYAADCEGRAPYYIPHDTVRLENRKGWTREGARSHIGNLYPQTKTAEIDMYTHLRRWIQFLETVLLRRPLRPEEFIFPAISVNSTVQTHKCTNHETIQKYLDEFAAAAGVGKEYSMHCFQSGGVNIGSHTALSASDGHSRRYGGGVAGRSEDVETLIR
ncbi:hypothetical protein WOLCODRAFT_160449 [Wolfiporia cocos MD-104 SS10]|uniref:Uncharacterized protein n=1 Tax=Wolfiporia cocos (strain MD-104) TaxID=742152 RepID=A0A2H3IW05_WOLCO|nr:hypothetical protein WOLCODRAFT_160449 [Wolfiporia cocos MD-104 SS10]